MVGFWLRFFVKGHGLGRGYRMLRRQERHPWSSCHHCRKENACQRRSTRERGRDVPQLEVLAALQSELCLGLADGALQTEHDLLGGLGLLSEDRLGLTTVTALLSVVTTLTLGVEGSLFTERDPSAIRSVRFCCATIVGSSY